MLVEDHPDSAWVVSVRNIEGGGSVKLVLCHLEEQTPVGKSEGHAAHLKESVSTNNDWN